MTKRTNLKYLPFNKVFKYLIVGIFLIFMPVFATAQAKMISGTVFDENKEPLPGVTVMVKETKASVITDFTGQFSIKANPTSQLVFSYMGFETLTTAIGNKASMVITLKSTTSNLEEIVVVGYGAVKRKDLTGSVSSVAMEDINKAPVRSFDDALAGRVAGVQVTSADGRPGSGVNIVIRGNNSVTQGNSPLYVVDGFLIEDPNNNVINPSDIESIDILKDASATAIYGARGANGVVVIQTKKGKEGKPLFSFSSTTGIQSMANQLDLMSPYEYVKYQLEFNPALTGTPQTPTEIYLSDGKTLDYYKTQKAINWQDLTSRTAIYRNNDFAVRGGTKKVKYSFSASATDQDGILLNSNYKRYQGRAIVDYAITNKLKVGVNVNYSYLEQTGIDPTKGENGSTTNVMTSIWGMRPVASDEFDLVNEFQDPDMNASNDYRINPVISLQNTYDVSKTNNINANGYVEYLFTKDLKLRSTFGVIENKTERDEFYNTKTSSGRPGSVSGVNGKISNNNYSNWLNENTLTWDKKLGEKSKLIALGGFTAQRRKTWSNGVAVNQLPNEDLMFDGFDQGVQLRVDPLASDWTMASFLTRVNYTYDSKYLFTASFRADGSSKFPSKNHWGYFPSAAFAWKFDEEKFFKNFEQLSAGKLRVSYGQTGNNRVGDFDYLTNYYDPIINSYVFNNQYVAGVVPTKLGNSDLKWETTEQIDAGIDLGFFKQRISFSVDVYKKTTKDLLLNTQLPPNTGFTTAFKNVGSVENKGIEFTLTTKNIVTKDFTWTSSANIAFNKSKLVALGEGQNTLESVIKWDNVWGNTSAYIAKIGEPLGLMYGYESLGTYKYTDFDQQPNGTYLLKAGVATNGNTRALIQPGDIKYKDQNGDGAVNSQDYTTIGHGLPVHTGGFSNNFTYKGFDLNIFFQWSYGNDILNANRLLFEGNSNAQGNLNQYASYQNRWSPENPDSDMFRTRGFFGGGYSSNYVEDGSYLRLKTVALGYNLDPKFVTKLRLKSLRFFVSGQNLVTWTKYSGLDPEVNTYSSALTPGFDFSAYPRARTIAFGTNITF